MPKTNILAFRGPALDCIQHSVRSPRVKVFGSRVGYSLVSPGNGPLK